MLDCPLWGDGKQWLFETILIYIPYCIVKIRRSPFIDSFSVFGVSK